MVEAGIDIFHCSQRRFWEPEFEGSDMNLAGWTKKLTGKPTVSVGSVTIPADGEGEMSGPAAQLARLEEMLARGDFDVVSVGRAILQNPNWIGIVQRGALDELATFDAIAARQALY